MLLFISYIVHPVWNKSIPLGHSINYHHFQQGIFIIHICHNGTVSIKFPNGNHGNPTVEENCLHAQNEIGTILDTYCHCQINYNLREMRISITKSLSKVPLAPIHNNKPNT